MAGMGFLGAGQSISVCQGLAPSWHHGWLLSFQLTFSGLMKIFYWRVSGIF